MKKGLLIIAVTMAMGTRAQDYFYSQMYNQPLMTNPALTGQFRGDYRVGLHYRTQWSAVGDAFKTPGASFDAKLVKRPGSRNFLSVGGYVLQDKAGKAGLKNFHAALNSAYNLVIDRSSSLAFGLQVGFIQRSINFDGLAWDRQYNGVAYDPALPTGEFFATQKTSGLDLGGGLVYARELNRDMDLVGGLAIFHYRQGQSFLGTEEDRLVMRQSLYGQVEHQTSIIDFTYHLRVYKQARALMADFGAQGIYRLGSDSRHSGINRSSGIIGGLYYRVGDSASLHAGFEYRRAYQFFVSYDVNVSGLRPATGMRGALEFSLIYQDWFMRSNIKVFR